MSTGIVRKIDDLGRVVIPAEMRRTLGVSEGDELEILLESDHIAIRPRFPTLIHSFSLKEGTRLNISGVPVELVPGDYVVSRIVRKR
ncbi:MAG TPA: AbrB/MazE/SpoVT family DNA-binding domain-containing protein [Acidimicrobiia bacterium]|nr:AbrB/MazE/SpoVT family DNA-binding domain-containing protein [Acidimicrobiia bacterium]